MISAPKGTGSYVEFLAVNEGRTLSKFEYLNMVMSTQGIHSDFFVFFGKLFFPTITLRGAGYFIDENIEEERYKEYVDDGTDDMEIAYWLNLVEVTALFKGLSYEQAGELAAVISECWNVALDRKFPESGFSSRVLLEEELGEVYVTLCKV